MFYDRNKRLIFSICRPYKHFPEFALWPPSGCLDSYNRDVPICVYYYIPYVCHHRQGGWFAHKLVLFYPLGWKINPKNNNNAKVLDSLILMGFLGVLFNVRDYRVPSFMKIINLYDQRSTRESGRNLRSPPSSRRSAN